MESKIILDKPLRLKKDILHAGIKKHQLVIDDFRAGIMELLDENTTETGDARPDEVILKLNQLAEQLRFAEDEMKILNLLDTTMDESIYDCVKLGSVVVTDKDVFFISVSLERFEALGISVFGLSVESPLFKIMKGLKVGNYFKYRADSYFIKDIY